MSIHVWHAEHALYTAWERCHTAALMAGACLAVLQKQAWICTQEAQCPASGHLNPDDPLISAAIKYRHQHNDALEQ